MEIAVDAKFAYFQYTHKHEMYGALIRVFDGLHDSRPENLPELAEQQVRFSTFFPLGPACNRGIVEVVGNATVARRNRVFPTFKTRVYEPDGLRGPWYLWDGRREWKKENLSEAELAFPNRGVVNDTLLIEWIREGHTNLDYPK